MLEEFSFDRYFLSKDDLVVVSDIHFSDNENALFREESKLANRLIDDIKDYNKVIINGDLFEDFSGPSRYLKNSFNRIIDFSNSNNIDVEIVEGNHDNYNYVDFSGRKQISLDDILITHGHIKPKVDQEDLIIIGHLHPAININGVLNPCFLYCENAFQETDVLVCPAYNSSLGVSIKSYYNGFDLKCPVIEEGKDILDYKPIMVADSKREFPSIRSMKNYL